MPVLDLSAEVAALGPVSGALPALSDQERALARLTWAGRMRNEHASAVVFEGLARQLEASGLGVEWADAARRMVDDERRHAAMCGQALVALGGRPVLEVEPAPPMTEHADASGPLEVALRNLLSVSCLSETVAVALIQGERLNMKGEVFERLLAGILADEVQHARLGWRVLEAHAAGLEPALRARLDAYLRVAFAHLERHELSNLSAERAPSEASIAAGVCDGLEARGLFYDTVEQIIVPRLEAHGFAAGEAWRRRAEARAAA